MPTDKQTTGLFGEQLVAKLCACPKCKRTKTLVRLPPNFKCADVVCDFCGFLGQVKTANVTDAGNLPNKLLGAAWEPQNQRMSAGIYFPLFIVLKARNAEFGIYYLSADLQIPEMFKPRSPLNPTARRAGWQGFILDIALVRDRMVRLI